ncbi:ogr/Delta-like zinc finger family protein [Pseudomonas guariconensis]|uniref:Transcriptional regulator n=1 Tax=Pseudomonas guariconensis TaxID=1288410 RepID=A0AAX0W3R3_9PSED|nr:ogr/Delta-like zinc finger family protein [Pseudomonas guariconensis]MCO7620807.1 ogr/Delta-like zinc finger family protein [Pseudomonas guariconensis]PLV21159.1 transcriptional regulator [Pseudomonas guariconensis]PLV26036.1 transcriptional regulator [Pseudomonas guariconensis]PLV31112.1 transcriptional regulator [Pseudomonas guariconensis]
MRIYCTTCGHKGRINSREEVTRTYVKLYCQCLDATCGHTWVSTLAFSHTLRPSAQHLDTLIVDRFRSMPADQQQELVKFLKAHAVA